MKNFSRASLRRLALSAWIVLVIVCATSEGSTLEKELTLTLGQKQILDKFREQVSNDLPHEYMKQDIYLIKWLRARNFDINSAKNLLYENLKWREENRMDEILNEDFGHFVKEYPFWLDGRDRQDRPVGTADISVWDPRPPIVSGQGDKLLRYALQVTEWGASKVREDQEAGKNVTQFTLISNLDGFNLIQHGCLRCIPFYINYLLAFQKYYPGQVHRLFLVNTPSAFDVLLRIVYPVLSDEIKDFLKIYGTNRKEWQKAVLEVVPEDQIRAQFGGIKPYES